MPSAHSAAYGSAYRRIRAMLLDPPVQCAHCGRRQATQLDHDPPLATHVHRPGTGCCKLIPACEDCNRVGGTMVADGTWRPNSSRLGTEVEPDPERAGLPASDKRWRRPWLRAFLDVPEDATWPRFMSVPHRFAEGSLGPEFCSWAEERNGRPLRWWQRLAATRILEVDGRGRLVWEAALVSTGRQVGKSWLLRELCLWRIHQADRFGEPQDVLHTGKDLAVCKEVQRPARVWAKARPAEYRVREVNGQEEIELTENGSRWMLRAKEAVYGYAAALGAVDEAWKVKASSVDEGLTPTMVEREQPQLLLVSTAHRLSTSLMLGRRQVALDQLERGEGDLLVEWSAPPDTDLDDPVGWRQASPTWTPRRHRMIASRLEAALTGKVEDPDEPDPVASFEAQWLNRWPRRLVEPGGPTEPLLPAGAWGELAEADVDTDGPVFVAIEDDYGLGAAVAAACRTADGRIEVDGWLCPDWDRAIADARALAGARRVRRLLVGASLVDRVPRDTRPSPTPAGSTETRLALSLLRDLVATGELVHDHATPELDQAMSLAQVREAPSGLFLVARGPTHLVRAAGWAVQAAHRPARVPAIL